MSPQRDNKGHVLQFLGISVVVGFAALGLSRQFGHLEEKVDSVIEAKKASDAKHREQDEAFRNLSRQQESTERDVENLEQWVGYPPPAPQRHPRRQAEPFGGIGIQ